MGNVAVTDLAPVRDDERRVLNLSHKVNHKQYCKHIRGEYGQSCLTELPWSIRDSISLYERMDASFNRIVELPVELPLRLPHLCSLNLSHNEITKLPESFSLLFHLRDLKLNHNKLTELPKSFTCLVKLEKLDLAYNVLKQLPEDMGTMEALTKLNLDHNRLRTLPISFGLSDSLEVIVVSNNKITFPPPHVCSEGSDAILRYFKRSSSKGDDRPVSNGNVFPRLRANQAVSTVNNPQSAQAEYIQSQTHTGNTPVRVKTPLLPPYGSSKLDALDLRDKILGLIYGAAIGDAIGLATQFMTVDECRFHYEQDTITYRNIVRDVHRTRWRQGDWTTNFDHFCLVLDSIVTWAGVVDELDFAKRLNAWYTHGFPELGDTEGYTFCKTIITVLEKGSYIYEPHHIASMLLQQSNAHINHHVDDEEEVVADTYNSAPLKRSESSDTVAETPVSQTSDNDADRFADNGALVRGLVLGIPFFHDIDEVANNARRICRATHADVRCQAVSTSLAVMLALTLQGHLDLDNEKELTKMMTRALDVGRRLIKDPSHVTEFQLAGDTESLDCIDANEPGQVVYVMKTLSVAIGALRSQMEFRDVIGDVIMMGGDSCANASVAGALVGAKLGYSRLPADWLDSLRRRQRDWLNVKVNLLLDMMGLP